jgi:hypothetical protein
VTDLQRMRVLYVGDDRRQESAGGVPAQRTAAELAAIEAGAMHLWEPCINSTQAALVATAILSQSTTLVAVVERLARN